MVDLLLGGVKWFSAVSYIDDIIVYSDTWDAHPHLPQLFQALRPANLQVHPGNHATEGFLSEDVMRAGKPLLRDTDVFVGFAVIATQAPGARGFAHHDGRGAPASRAGRGEPLGVELGDSAADRLPHRRRGEASRRRGNGLAIPCGGGGEGLGAVIQAVPELVQELAKLLEFCWQEAIVGREQHGEASAGNLFSGRRCSRTVCGS
ncbi:hypothetical protein Emag_007793 [Eimeria magna]